MGKTVAFLPFRKGSKGIPDKNIRGFNGVPLYAHVARIVSEIPESIIDTIVLATDYPSDKVLKELGDLGSRIQVWDRSGMSNAEDTASTEMVIHDWILYTGADEYYDTLVLIQVTNPFITSSVLGSALREYDGRGTRFSAVPFHGYLWQPVYSTHVSCVPVGQVSITKRKRRQENDVQVVLENGSFYIFNIGKFLVSGNRFNDPCLPVLMPKQSMIEIDSEEDWDIAEKLYRQV